MKWIAADRKNAFEKSVFGVQMWSLNRKCFHRKNIVVSLRKITKTTKNLKLIEWYKDLQQGGMKSEILGLVMNLIYLKSVVLKMDSK